MIWDMAKPRREAVTEDQLQGFKYFKKLLPLLDSLHDHATERDRAGNRQLHFDQYLSLQLLFFFNPVITSMRGLVQASSLGRVRRKLGIASTSLGSFSEAGGVFDAQLLKPVIKELGRELRPLKHDSRLDDLPGVLTAVDGTEITALSNLVGRSIQGRQIKLHTHFEPLTGVPVDIDLTAASDSEIENLLERLLPERVYVKDRGYACFRLFQGILDAGSHFVCRIRDNSVYEVLEDKPLPAEAKEAGILSDQIVWLGSAGKREELRAPLRVIRIACKPHHKRGVKTGRGGPGQGDFLLIATDLVDLPAEVIGLVFRLRWTVELFFRFFKYLLGCRHLLSHRDNGIEIQVYLAIIVCMLIALWTGRKPTLRTLEMIRFYFTGWASVEELEAHIGKLEKMDL
ncbi:MAG: IS4 family transposase [Phycisphaerae bacterium]